MRSTRLAAVVATLILVAGIVACAGLQSTAAVSNIRMTTDQTGQTATSSYAPGAPFYVFADLSNIAVGSTIEVRWYAVDAQGLASNSEINTSDYKYESGVKNVYFQLTTPDGSDWPTGSYRVELYLDGTKVGEQGFTVQ